MYARQEAQRPHRHLYADRWAVRSTLSQRVAENVLFMAPRFHTNQVDFVERLVRAGYRVSFIAMGTRANEDHSLIVPRVLKLSFAGRLLNRFLNPDDDLPKRTLVGAPQLTDLYRALRDAKPDVVVVRGLFSPYILFALPYFLARRTRIVIYTQGARFRSQVPIRLRLFSLLALDLLRWDWFTTVDHVGVACEGAAVHPRLRFIPFFKNVSDSAVTRDYNVCAPRLLGIGKFIERKNLLMLLNALAHLGPSSTMSLTWVGECSTAEHRAYLATVQRQIDRLGLTDRVRLLTNLPHDEVARLYRSHDIFVMPSVDEPASVSQVEAMAGGLPVICSGDNGTAHYIRHGFNGYIIDATAEELAGCLRRYADSPQMIRLHGQNSVQLMKSTFSIDRAFADFQDMIA